MSAPIALKCPNCAAPLRHENWNVHAGVIKCTHCGVLSSVPGNSSAQGFAPRAEVPQPSRIKIVEQSPMSVALSQRWLSAELIFLIPFCIAWDSFLVFFYTGIFNSPNPSLFVILFPIAHLAVGVGLTYYVIASLFNTTSISAGSGRLRVKHGPVPWRGQVELEGSDISQLFCKEKARRTKSGYSYTYEVWAVMRDSTTKKVVTTGLNMDQALFIEQKLERALGIQDRPVPGEVAR